MESCVHHWDAWWNARARAGAVGPVQTWVRTCARCGLSEVRPLAPGCAPSNEDRVVVGRLIPAE